MFDIFGLLSVGGAIVMPSETERYQPEAWHRLLMTQGVTFLELCAFGDDAVGRTVGIRRVAGAVAAAAQTWCWWAR